MAVRGRSAEQVKKLIDVKPDGAVEHLVATDILFPPFVYTLTIDEPPGQRQSEEIT